MLSIEIKTPIKTNNILRKQPEVVRRAFIKGVKRAILIAEAEAKKKISNKDKATNSDRLGVITGHLRRSIASGLKISGNKLVADLHSNVIYAAIHEFGNRSYFIFPKNKKVLRFKNKSGEWIFTKKVHMKAGAIRARPYLRPAIKESLKRMENMILKTMREEFKKL